MNMKKYLQDIYKVFSQDETLLRLLYYQPSNALDSPLDESKENILDKTEEDKWVIIKDKIKFTPTYDGLDKNHICRLFFYAGRRYSDHRNYLIADQDIKIDVFTHSSYNDVDLRLSWLCDHVNSLMFDSRITGMGKIMVKQGTDIPAPENYVGYQLIYEIGSFNK